MPRMSFDKVPAGTILTGQAATLGKIDGSRVAHWCRRAEKEDLFLCEKVVLRGQVCWFIDRVSFMAWVRERRR